MVGEEKERFKREDDFLIAFVVKNTSGVLLFLSRWRPPEELSTAWPMTRDRERGGLGYSLGDNNEGGGRARH